tara:strand:- start:4363 stop:4812 length:450 start_codon:yes stop_codon:yes gene_type:complete
MKVSKNFYLEEMVPRNMYEIHGDKCIHLIDDRIIEIAQILRDEFGVMVANTWYYFKEPNGDEDNYRGWRPWDYVSKGKEKVKFSAHKFGRAIDLISPKRDIEEMRQHIIDHHKEKFSLIRRIEGRVNYLHVDVANTMTDELIMFSPPLD